MKLRIARKITNAIGTVRENAYTLIQLGQALARLRRTKSARKDNKFWNALMDELGPLGRAKLLSPGKAFDLLMRTPENEWEGKPNKVRHFKRGKP